MKKLLPILLLCWGISASYLAAGQVSAPAAAAEQPDDKLKETHCGTADITEEYLDAHPEIRERLAAIAEQTRQYIEEMESQDQKANGPLITIPVVVHIVSYTDPSNPTVDQDLRDAVIQSQIDELNLAFRGALQPGPRANVTGVPSPYDLRVGDAQVQFCLATRGPDGRPTNGITRRNNTDPQYWRLGSDVMSTARGGTDAWNTAHYLNIWCHDMGGDPNGVSEFPGRATNPRLDGVSIDYTAFGRGPHTVPNSRHTLGRVAVHEVGHWLNLKHIWGDVGGGLCVDSDDVSDTPNQSGGNAGNPYYTMPPTSSCPLERDGDMFMNFMDYADDDSNLMFTRRQALRMQASFAPATPTRRGGYRESLRSSPGLCPTLRIISQSGTLPTTVQAGDRTDYRFRPYSVSASCGGTILYHWEATGNWTVTDPDQFYPQIIPTGNSASTITLTATYINPQGFSFPLTPVQHVVNYLQAPTGGTPINPDLALPPAPTPVFTSPPMARCPGIPYPATVAPVPGASGYRWTVPTTTGFEYNLRQGQGWQPMTGPVTTTAPDLYIASTTTLPGRIYLLQCQTLAPNRTPSAMASVPLTINGGPPYQIVDSDAYQRTATTPGIVCQQNRIFLHLEPTGPVVLGAVKASYVNPDWSSNILLSNNFTPTNSPTTLGQRAYQTINAPNRSFALTVEYADACGNIISTAPYTAMTAPVGTTSLSNGYSCTTYPARQAAPVIPPSAPYPNPAADRLHLPGYQGPVVVYDHQGQPVQRLLAPGTEAGPPLNTSTWPEGLYVITGRNLLGEWQRHNVQIQH